MRKYLPFLSVLLVAQFAVAAPLVASQGREMTSQTATSNGVQAAILYYPRASAHRRDEPQQILITLVTSQPQNLMCFGTADFRVTVTDATGKAVPPEHPVTIYAESDNPPIIKDGSCVYAGRPTTHALYSVNFDYAYDHLMPGKYKVLVTVVPQDGSFPALDIPAAPFIITR